MSLSTAIGTLAAISVSGVTKSYTLAQLTSGVAAPNLPALLPLPAEGENERMTYGYAETDSYNQRHLVRHRLLSKAVQNSNQGEAMASVVTLIDAYFSALNSLSSHAGAIDILLQSYKAGVMQWQGIEYYGCDFFVQVEVME